MSKYLPWKSFEQEIVRDLKAHGFSAKRNWETQFSRTDPVDIRANDGVREFVIQNKYGARPNIKQAITEARAGITGKKQIPLALTRFKGTRDTLVSLSWKDFLKILDGE